MRVPQWKPPPYTIETVGELHSVETKCEIVGNWQLPAVTVLTFDYGPGGIGQRNTRLRLMLDPQSLVMLRKYFLRQALLELITQEN